MDGRASTDGPAQAAGPADEALLALFAQGDPRAARLLTERLGPRAFSVALRVLGNRAEAEDVAQEAMLRLWRTAPDWQAGRARVSTWLYRVVLNLCLDRKRRAKAVDLDAVPEPPDTAPPALEVLQQAARVDALQAALMHLPDRQRQAVVLRHIEELSNPEIAEIMGIGVEAVESLTARGKRALAGHLAGQRAALGYEDER
ncbi:RNA polymerase sigma factor [Ruegeria pomeroyi]|uniref:RNA polymerase sigma-70 factor, ECF family n=2 Tax=Ruegeria pomeroyi TaxID=89184 RepID=Q5LPU3_RUEPO|nr:RNA polymerase sigma factor [Ruegeria pomeroyi]HCE70214.1 RNA polymerase sigma factor [Ruegeria sp.]AAV95997.1 RNA polymerase sigma-70 factor, ECF family [Ruegeria pomeroyi DSS-3]NVK97647.1 RNA polymerase sigma factor [Ruegeria pomeroyi]NVL01345.1 RNA polymerase sigma factor [Ruegeria pomeroyi]QWV09559.1 RNA polymerase sigma factor [Ruegeria pomeroyi]